VESLRAEFPILERIAYLNTGSVGPVPRRGAEAAQAELAERVAGTVVGHALFEGITDRADQLRGRLAGLMGCAPGEVAITGSTTDGVNTVVAGLELAPGDEVLTSDEEHPGLLAPLAAGRARHGFEVRAVPFDELAGEVSARTRLVACSHVSWLSGRVVDATALAASDAAVLLDGAQGLGAIPVDVRALGCDFYAASGQKWICGPIGSGCLYVSSEHLDELSPPWPGYGTVADPARALDFELKEGAQRLDTRFPSSDHLEWSHAALDVLEDHGFEAVHERGPALAARLADGLLERGREVAPRGPSTLVAWESDDPGSTVATLAAAGVVIREFPGQTRVRASVGAWSNEDDLQRLLAALA
jgi:L-cysteine/cystine lyase